MKSVVYKNYVLEHVFGSMNEVQTKNVVDFWIKYGAIPNDEEARRRAPEVACIARNAAKEIVAISTLYTGGLGNPAIPHYFYRMFIRPEDRSSGLFFEIVALTRESLAEARQPNQAEQGLVAVTENPSLMRVSMQAAFEKFGWSYVGKNSKNQDVWRLSYENMNPPADWRTKV